MRTPSWGLMGLGSMPMCPNFLLSHVVVAAAEPRWLRDCRVLAACWGPSPPRPGPAANEGHLGGPTDTQGSPTQQGCG